jgi:hypothetical protein
VDDAPVHDMGPTAQDVRAAFVPGRGDQMIGTADADGVALAAIQALEQWTAELRAPAEEAPAFVPGWRRYGSGTRSLRACPRDSRSSLPRFPISMTRSNVTPGRRGRAR